MSTPAEFSLLESVVNDERGVVFVEHKDLPARGMLVSERYQEYVRQLEATVRALVAPAAGPTFLLAGSVSVAANGDDLDAEIASLRADHAVRTAHNLFAVPERETAWSRLPRWRSMFR